MTTSVIRSSSSGGSSELLQLLATPEIFKARLLELETTEKRAEAMVRLVGPAREIEKLQEQARTHQEETIRVLDQTKKTCKTKLSEAQSKVDQMVETAEKKAKAILDSANQVKESLTSRAFNANQRDKEMQQQSKTLQDQRRILETNQAKFQKEQSDLEFLQLKLNEECDFLLGIRDYLSGQLELE